MTSNSFDRVCAFLHLAGFRYWTASLLPALVGTTLPFWLCPPGFSFRLPAAIEFLFAALIFHAGFSFLLALFEGNLIAKIFADGTPQPKAGLIAYNSRFVLGGDPNNESFNKDIAAYFRKTVLPSRNGEGFLVTFTSGSERKVES